MHYLVNPKVLQMAYNSVHLSVNTMVEQMVHLMAETLVLLKEQKMVCLSVDCLVTRLVQ